MWTRQEFCILCDEFHQNKFLWLCRSIVISTGTAYGKMYENKLNVYWPRSTSEYVHFFMPRFYQSTHHCCSTKTTIYETLFPWPMSRWWCRFPFLLCSQSITSVSSVYSSRFLELLSSRNHLPVSWVSTVLLNSLQLAAHAVGNEQKKIVIMSSTSNIIY